MRQVLPLVAYIIAVAVMYAILHNGLALAPDLQIPFALLSILIIGGFSIAGLFQKSLTGYVCFSTIIQFGYFLLDLSTALLIGKSVWFAVLQLINFAIAGGLFAVVISIMHNSLKKENVPEYAGLFEKNQMLVLALVISGLALGGMPGFNIFVGEFIIYSSLFAIHPALTVLAVFAGLLCFIFYFRILYVMFAGTTGKAIKLGIISRLVTSVLAVAVVVLGVVPHILLAILEWYT